MIRFLMLCVIFWVLLYLRPEKFDALLLVGGPLLALAWIGCSKLFGLDKKDVQNIRVDTSDFDDPAPMSNHHLVSAIAGQADWLEKMNAAPVEAQASPDIKEIALKRRGYIVKLCMEVRSRGLAGEDVFREAAQAAKELEVSGVPQNIASVRAVKESMFEKNAGVFYSSSWEA